MVFFLLNWDSQNLYLSKGVTQHLNKTIGHSLQPLKRTQACWNWNFRSKVSCILNHKRRRKMKKFPVLAGRSELQRSDSRGRLGGIWDATLTGEPASLPPHRSMNSMGSWKTDFTQPAPPYSKVLSLWTSGLRFFNHPCLPSAQFHVPSVHQLSMGHMGHDTGLVDAILCVARTFQFCGTLQMCFKGMWGGSPTATFGGRKKLEILLHT